MRKHKTSVVLAGLVGLMSTAAWGQVTFDPNAQNTGQVNISGATLFRPFFEVPASTNDYIDADNDGRSGFDPVLVVARDQLAENYTLGGALFTEWLVQYRGVGSVNGLGEFVTSQLCNRLRGSIPSELGMINRQQFASAGAKTAGALVSQLDCLTFDPAFPLNDPNQGGSLSEQFGYLGANGTFADDSGTPVCPIEVHIAILDVPSAWGVAAGNPATGKWNKNPLDDGYGYNPNLTYLGWDSSLESLARNCGGYTASLNANVDAPDNDTVYDTTVAWAAITYIANAGVGRPDLDGDGEAGDMALTDLWHLFVTGRTRSGENLNTSTRSSGSGTHNGIMNTSGVDPAWAVGDDYDVEWANSNLANMGPNRRINAAEGSTGTERATQSSRLAIGYTGLFGNERAAFDSARNRYKVLNIQFDDRGGNDYVRPSAQNVIVNCDANTGFQLGGPVTFVSRGDPFEDNAAHPAFMEDRAAAKYLENIESSVINFTEPNGIVDPNNNFMPGQYLAQNFTLVRGVDCQPQFDNPSNFVNNNPVPALRSYLLAGALTTVRPYDDPNFAAGGGMVPRRAAFVGNPLAAEHPSLDPNGVWDDGSTTLQTVYRYQLSNGTFATIAREQQLGSRNRVQGDFNYDQKRDVNDVAKMMEAYTAPMNFEMPTVWPGSAGNQVENRVIVHVIGDFDGDGNFRASDVRYFADGLALDPAFPNGKYGPMLNRKLGFTRVDTNWALQPGGDNNFFNTTLATPKAYAPGDSRGDVAGNNAAPGHNPIGWDGAVDADDIDYLYANFGDWSNLDVAVDIDLSCDMTGPEVAARDTFKLVVDQKDVDELVQVILGTTYGDVNLDGVANATDCAIIEAHLGQAGGWAQGDVNGDGLVNNADQVLAGCAAPAFCLGDSDCDGDVDFFDIDPFVAKLGCPGSGPACNDGCQWQNSDVDEDGDVDFFDIDPFVARLGQICP